MKNEKQLLCPGCGRHCPASAPRCKYGRNYFAKKSACSASSCPHSECAFHPGRTYKWEKHAPRETLLGQFLLVGCKTKKALKNKNITQQQLLESLPQEETQRLSETLAKLNALLP